MRAYFLVLALAVATPLAAQEVPPTPSNIAGFGPLDAAQPSGITIAQIMERMGARESDFEHARNQYTFRQTVKMDTIAEDTGKPDGEFADVEDITFDNAGHRVERVVFAPANTLERVIMTETDVNDVKQRLPFILTTAQLPEYNLNYVGKQRVDSLDTFVFEVVPKQLVKGHRYFQGKVWVDQQDMEIVLVNGLNVPQDTRRGHEDLSPPFTTYYQQIDGKYWFPTYTRAEGVLHFAAQNGALSQEVHMRDTVRYTEYKRYHTSVTIEYAGQELPSDSQSGNQSGTPSASQGSKSATPAPPQP